MPHLLENQKIIIVWQLVYIELLVSVYFCFCFSAFGDVFAGIGCREPQPNASEAFTAFGEAHRSIERYAIKMLKTVKPVKHASHFFPSELMLYRLRKYFCLNRIVLEIEEVYRVQNSFNLTRCLF